MKIETYKDKTGQHRFRVRAKNGEILAQGEDYQNKSDMLATIDALRIGMMHAKLVEADDDDE